VATNKRRSKSKDYPTNDKVKARYDAFCMAYHQNGGNGQKAAEEAGYKATNARQTASQLLTLPYIEEKLESLRSEVKEAYSVSIEKRLRILEKVTDMGFREQFDQHGNAKSENLNAVVAAVKELNAMCGIDEEKEEAKSLNISFSVSDAVSEIKVTNATA